MINSPSNTVRKRQYHRENPTHEQTTSEKALAGDCRKEELLYHRKKCPAAAGSGKKRKK